MIYQTATISQQGGRPYNEDYCGSFMRDDQLNCWVVADGLGGHGGGEVASKLAVETCFDSLTTSPAFTGDTLKLLFDDTQAAIVKAQKNELRLANMQTTAVILLARDDHTLWGHVGDSRLYYFHDGIIKTQTSDHSVPQLLAKAGEIKTADIRFHEDRNRLLRSIGSDVGVKPTIEKIPLPIYSGDAFLLCTDGFWEYVFENEMEEDLKQSNSAEEWLSIMEKRLLTRVPERNDNYSAISIRVL